VRAGPKLTKAGDVWAYQNEASAQTAAASNTLAIQIISAAPTTHKGTLSSRASALSVFVFHRVVDVSPALLIQLAAQQWCRRDKERTQRMVAKVRCLTNTPKFAPPGICCELRVTCWPGACMAFSIRSSWPKRYRLGF